MRGGGPGGGMRGPGGGMRGPGPGGMGGFGRGLFGPLGMWLRPLWGRRPFGCMGCLSPILGVIAILGLVLLGLVL